MKNSFSPSEFSHCIALEEIDNTPKEFLIRATEAERKSLAIRLQIEEMLELKASGKLVWINPDSILSLKVKFDASIVQACVVTLDLLNLNISEYVELEFSRSVMFNSKLIDINDAEPLEGEHIDVGEIVVEELSLAIDPYPRRKNIQTPVSHEKIGSLLPGDLTVNYETIENRESSKNNPFSVLEKLKPKR
tara:strand:- start:88 stop:660 length:573 start_codon:yes stop_codon:yes gene_type:complete